MPTLIPVLGEELSHVQFRSLEEQLFRSMAVLFDQEQRQGVARLVGMRAPVSLFTPFIKETFIRPERVEQYRQRLLKRISFALEMAEATKRLAARQERFTRELVQSLGADEPTTARRRVK